MRSSFDLLMEPADHRLDVSVFVERMQQQLAHGG